MKTFLVVLLSLLFNHQALGSIVINVDEQITGPIGEKLEYFKENLQQIELSEAIETFELMGLEGQQPILNFGINSQPVWLHFDVNNPENVLVERQIEIATSWLDKIDVFVINNGVVITQYHDGDSLPYGQRESARQNFSFKHLFSEGISSVYIRVDSDDPMLLPISFRTPAQAQQDTISQVYIYGFIYGVLIALLAYNACIYFNLRDKRFLYYVIYLSAFLLMNMAYTGHAFNWFWPNSPHWQQWSIPILMVTYSISGLLFTVNFLATKTNYPSLHKVLMNACFALSLALLVAAIINSRVLALYIAFGCALLFPVLMISSGIVALYSGQRSAKYFLFAISTAMLGVVITGLSVVGIFPASNWGYHALEIGIQLEALFLALALSEQFRLSQLEKTQAQKLAMLDQLTGLNNRRGFSMLIEPVLSRAKSEKIDISLIMLDIDKFKVINDKYGHSEGDRVLTCTANLLAKNARKADICGRWGGEEFIILLPQTSLDEACLFADRLRTQIQKLLIESKTDNIHITASFGVANLCMYTHSFEEMLVAADKCLYKAKANGRNKVCSQINYAE